jgi:hypothetical protein
MPLEGPMRHVTSTCDETRVSVVCRHQNAASQRTLKKMRGSHFSNSDAISYHSWSKKGTDAHFCQAQLGQDPHKSKLCIAIPIMSDSRLYAVTSNIPYILIPLELIVSSNSK